MGGNGDVGEMEVFMRVLLEMGGSGVIVGGNENVLTGEYCMLTAS